MTVPLLRPMATAAIAGRRAEEVTRFIVSIFQNADPHRAEDREPNGRHVPPSPGMSSAR